MKHTLQNQSRAELWAKYHILSSIAQEALEAGDDEIVVNGDGQPHLKRDLAQNPINTIARIVRELASRGVMDSDMEDATVENLQWRYRMMMEIIDNDRNSPEEVNRQCRNVALKLEELGHPVGARVVHLKPAVTKARAITIREV